MNILRLGWSVTVAIQCLAAPSAAHAQDVVRADVPATHTVKRGDTLWDLAKSYLGDAYLWPSIYRLNTDQIEDPHWIYPAEILRLPGQSAVPVTAEHVRTSRAAPTVFQQARATRTISAVTAPVVPPRVAIGDFVRASYLAPERGPRGAGRILFGADIPGIDRERSTTNFKLFDRLLMEPPVGSVAAEGERFVSYTLGETVEELGTIVTPTALLQVVRAPRNGEAATVEVRELYGMLDANAPVMALDTVGSGVTGAPLPYRGSRVGTIRAVHRVSVLPSLNYEILFDLSSKDGMKVGDEIQVFRSREKELQDERPAVPEVAIAMAQVIRVTPYGSTARITSQEQPAIRVGESVRVTARMP